MNRLWGFEFLFYALVLASLSVLVHLQSPSYGRVTLISGIAGSLVSGTWGVLAIGGYRRRWWAILTLTMLLVVFLSQAGTAWLSPVETESRTFVPAALVTLMLVFTFGLLMNLIRAPARIPGEETQPHPNQHGRQELPPNAKPTPDTCETATRAR